MISPDAAWRPPESRIIRGCWQLSRGHGPGWSRERAFEALDAAAAERGGLVLDCADIYTGVEALVGDWMRARGADADQVRVHTKFVPDLDELPRLGRDRVRRSIDRSRRRLGVAALDLVQLHWWDLAVKGWMRTAEWLAELREEGQIRNIGATNFGTEPLGALLDAGIPVVSNQVQLSLIDRRPLARLAALCEDRGVALLCYGTLAGGLLGIGRGAAAEPAESRSLVKYRLVAREAGGPDSLERAREALARIASRQGAAVADVAVAYVLAQRAVGAAIVGLSRRGLVPRPHRVRLGAEEAALLEEAVPGAMEGAVYGAERDREGPHGRIMRYDLNRAGG